MCQRKSCWVPILSVTEPYLKLSLPMSNHIKNLKTNVRFLVIKEE